MDSEKLGTSFQVLLAQLQNPEVDESTKEEFILLFQEVKLSMHFGMKMVFNFQIFKGAYIYK